MKIRGQVRLPGAPANVWNLLTDPARLVKCLPGCEKLEPDGPNRYKVIVKFGLAAISGSYSGTVELSQMKQPESLRMRLEGKGTPGFMSGEGELRLVEQRGETSVSYEGEAQVGGLIASVGQRMIEAAARRIIQQFFDSAAAELRSSGSS